MLHPITKRIRDIKRLARRLAISRGIGMVVLCSLAAGLVVAAFDFLLRLEDTGTRVLLSFVWLAAIGGSAWYWIRPILKSEWSDLSIAHMIERRFPSLANRLSSSLSFLNSDESMLGSKPLMRNVIGETTDRLANINVRDAVDSKPTLQIVGLAMASLALLVALCVFGGSQVPKSIARLLLPWKENPWPRVNHLAFVDAPDRIARGADLRLSLVDETATLPPRVDLQIWYDGDRKSEADAIPMQRSEDQMVFERTNISRSFKYRAVGGDDQSMPWNELQVVEAPQIVAGTIHLTPPSYTGWETNVLDEAVASLRLLQGTSVTLHGTADRPLKSTQLKVKGADSQQNFNAMIAADGLRYTVPSKQRAQTWTVDESGEYSLSLVDQDGTQTVDADQWSVRMLRDEAPSLSLLEPDAEELITPRAIVPIVCEVEDDLAVKRVELRFLRTDNSSAGETTVALLDGPQQLASVPMPENLPPPTDRRVVRHDWSLEAMRLPPGAVLSFHLIAKDYKQQSNQTLARRLVVVSESDLIDRAGRRQSLVLSRLQQRLKQQRLAKQSIDAVQTHLEETGTIEKATMDRLQSALMAQRQVNSALHGDDAEVTKELRRLQKLLDRSQIGETDVRSRIDTTLSSLQQLGGEHLDPAIRHSTAAMQSLQAQRDQDKEDSVPDDAPKDLQTASQHQASALQQLESLLDDMSAWDNYRRFAQELSDLLRHQRDVKQTTQDVAKETLSRDSLELDGQSRAALRGAAARQLDLARRMDRTLGNLAKAEQELSEKDPQAAQMVQEAMQAAREGAIAGKMRQAGRQIDQNRLGLAGQQQADAEQSLEDMLDELSRRSYSPEERAEKLEDAGRELERLQKRQSQLSQEFAKAEREQDETQKKRELQRLKKRQEQISEKTRKLERQLQRLRANQSSQQIGQAATSSENASNAADKGDAQQALEQSQLSEAQMTQAQQSLEQAQQEAKSELAREQMVRLPQLIEALIAQQMGVIEEVERLHEIRTQRGELSTAQETSVEVTAESQRAVAQDTGLVANQMKQLPAFVFALTEAQDLMIEVADALDGFDTSNSTQQLATRVLDELKLIREMLEEEKPSKQDQQQSSGGESGQQQNNAGGEPGMDAQMAQLKLLRGMQISINDETKRLNKMTAGDYEAQRIIDGQLQDLAARQNQLGRIVGDMFQPAATALDQPQQDESSGELQPGTGNAELPNLDALDQQLDQLLQ